MYGGRVMERGPVDSLFANPAHPYTKALLRSIPRVNLDRGEPLMGMRGSPTEVNCTSELCPFLDRCAEREDFVCQREAPPVNKVGENHYATCFLAAAPSGQGG